MSRIQKERDLREVFASRRLKNGGIWVLRKARTRPPQLFWSERSGP